MASIHLETTIDAHRERDFALARCVDVHVETMAASDERAAAGVTEGRLADGDEVTWRARHLGVPLTLSVEITTMDRPVYVRDEHVDGPFAWMEHDHHFESDDHGGTRLIDDFRFASPLGRLGRALDALVLRRYPSRRPRGRNDHLPSWPSRPSQ